MCPRQLTEPTSAQRYQHAKCELLVKSSLKPSGPELEPVTLANITEDVFAHHRLLQVHVALCSLSNWSQLLL